MRQKRTSDLILIGLCMLLVLFACAPQTRREVMVAPKPDIQPEHRLQLDSLDRKIIFLTEILKRQDLSREKRLEAQSLLSTYETVREILERPLLREDYQKIIELLYGSLMQIDEEYFEKYGTDEKIQVQSGEVYAKKRNKIVTEYLMGNHQMVVDRCVELEKELGPSGLTSDIALLYALSLGENGRYEEALNISSKISAELERMPGFIQFRAKTIEWHLALGNQQEALGAYEKLADTFKERETLFKLAERQVKPDSSKATSEISPSQEIVSLTPTEVTEPTTTEEALKKADELIRRGDYEKAKFLLFQHRLRLEEGAQAETIDRAIESLDSEERTRPSPEEQQGGPTPGETMKMASALIEGEKYEEALDKLNEIKQKEELSPEAKGLETIAIEKIINRERNKAAKLFLLARNTADLAKKEELLRSSYEILKAVSGKYPTSPLNKRINDNMRAIQGELNKLKPTG